MQSPRGSRSDGSVPTNSPRVSERNETTNKSASVEPSPTVQRRSTDPRLKKFNTVLRQSNAASSGELSPRMLQLLEKSSGEHGQSEKDKEDASDSANEDESYDFNGDHSEGFPDIDNLYSQLTGALRAQAQVLQNEKVHLRKEQASLAQKREAFEAVKKNMAEVLKLQESRVKLNVGGCKFVTSLDTLLMYPDSMLGNMFSGKFKLETDEKGYFFIDRDGTHFRYILNFLRTGSLVVPEDPLVMKELKMEAEFYQIRPLIAALSSPMIGSGPAQFSGAIVPKNTRFCSADRTSVAVSTKGTCRVLVDTASIHDGKRYWEIRLDKLQNPNCIAVGLTRTTGELNLYVGSTKDGWSIIVMNRDTLKRWSSPLCEEYGVKGSALQEGDRVGMLLDYTKGNGGQLSFYINGINQGVAFYELPPHLFPAVSLHSKGDQISLISTELPSDSP